MAAICFVFCFVFFFFCCGFARIYCAAVRFVKHSLGWDRRLRKGKNKQREVSTNLAVFPFDVMSAVKASNFLGRTDGSHRIALHCYRYRLGFLFFFFFRWIVFRVYSFP